MTIKQQGGVFGRNPSFNDVDVNTLDVAGQVTAGSLNVDAGTLFVDAVNNFVGIGTAAPGDRLTVNGNIYLGATSRTVYTGGSADLMLQTNTGNTLISRDNGSTEIARFTTTGMAFPSGKGIDFSATAGTGTSELFDDYEEGTFSGSISGITATTATYAGTYTKLGNICHVQILLTISGKTAGAGNPSIAVPFSAASTSTPQFGGQPTANGIFASADMYFAVYNGGATVFAYNESGATLGAANWNDGVTAVNFTYKTA